MALTTEQINALARHSVQKHEAKQAQTQLTARQDAELMEAYRRLDGPFPAASEANKASQTLSTGETSSPETDS